MAIVLLVWVSLWLVPQLASCIVPAANTDTAGLPVVLFRVVNDSLTEIKLNLDDTQQSILEKQALYIPVIIEMNRSIRDQGVFDSELAISSRVYTRFLSFIDIISTAFAIQMTQLYLRAINLIEVGLQKFICDADRIARTVKLLKYVIFEIAPKVGKVTADNKKRFWYIYDYTARQLVRLQNEGSPTTEAYVTRLDYWLDYAVRRINRYIREVGNLLDEFSSEVASKLLDIVREALNPSVEWVGSTVEPFVSDKLEL